MNVDFVLIIPRCVRFFQAFPSTTRGLTTGFQDFLCQAKLEWS